MSDYSQKLFQQLFKSQIQQKRNLSAFDFQRIRIVQILRKHLIYKKEAIEVVRFLRGIPDFQAMVQELENDEIMNLLKGCRIIEVPTGEVIFKKKDIADSFYIILKGTVEFYDISNQEGQQQIVVFNRQSVGRCFGSKAFAEVETVRALFAKAITQCQLLQIFQKNVLYSLASTVRQIESQKRNFIEQHLPNSKWLTKQQKEKLLHLFSISCMKKHQIIVQAQTYPNALFFVLEGECLRKQHLQRRIFSKVIMGPGSFFGEETIQNEEASPFEISVYSKEAKIVFINRKDIIYIPQVIQNKILLLSTLKKNHLQKSIQFLINSQNKQPTFFQRNDNDEYIKEFKNKMSKCRNETAKH